MTPIHYCMVGLLAFIILAISSRLLGGTIVNLFVILLILSGVIYLFLHQLKQVELDELEQIQYVNHQAENGLASLLDKMPVGVIKVNGETNEVEWFNPYAELIFSTEDGQFDVEYLQQVLAIPFEGKGHYATIGDKKYSVYLDSQASVVYFFDASSEYEANVGLVTTRPVIGIMSVDNYDDLEDVVSDSDISSINGFIANFVEEFSEKYHMFYRRVGMDRFYLFTDYTVLEQLIESKFSIIDQFREEAKNRELPITVSMGFSYADDTQEEMDYGAIAKFAQDNLDLALGRGGDQVVVRSKNEETRFYGGKSNPLEKRTRVRSRMVSQALENLIAEADQVMVMGHQYPDMDCIGGCLGIRRIAKMHGKTSWIVTNPEQYSHDIKKLMEVIKDNERLSSAIVNPEMAEALLTENTLVIIVDVSKPSLCAAPSIVKKANKLVIIDHHRRGEEFPENPDLVYIEPYASSAGELITELLEYQSEDAEKLQAIEATTLLAGIIVDTRNFTLRTGSRTFDTASYLKSVGADTILIQRLLKENVDTYLMRSHLLNSLEMLPNNVGIVHGEENTVYPTVVAAQTADMMLSMENIDASFVVTKRNDGRVGISARSLGNKNVQRVMEKMGGGGHLSNAATQLSDITIEDAIRQLIQVIEEIGSEINL